MEMIKCCSLRGTWSVDIYMYEWTHYKRLLSTPLHVDDHLFWTSVKMPSKTFDKRIYLDDGSFTESFCKTFSTKRTMR